MEIQGNSKLYYQILGLSEYFASFLLANSLFLSIFNSEQGGKGDGIASSCNPSSSQLPK